MDKLLRDPRIANAAQIAGFPALLGALSVGITLVAWPLGHDRIAIISLFVGVILIVLAVLGFAEAVRRVMSEAPGKEVAEGNSRPRTNEKPTVLVHIREHFAARHYVTSEWIDLTLDVPDRFTTLWLFECIVFDPDGVSVSSLPKSGMDFAALGTVTLRYPAEFSQSAALRPGTFRVEWKLHSSVITGARATTIVAQDKFAIGAAVRIDMTPKPPPEHVKDIQAYVQRVIGRGFPVCLDDFDPMDKLRRVALRTHFPSIARLEDQLRDWDIHLAEIRQAIERHAVREAAFLFPGVNPEGPKRVLQLEADSFGRNGKPHFEASWLELRDDGDLWFGAFGLERWHLAEDSTDIEGVRCEIMEILRGVHEWEEVREYRMMDVTTLRAQLAEYENQLSRIAVSPSLPRQCEICTESSDPLSVRRASVP